ncbi:MULTISPECIES: peptidoglycan-binding domain-containing protein [Oerskovia]|uniref:Peptidoglycan-binding protein n=1 Tax=Oerskovia merdavium TaxID=2762227 RepID=A0ABR8U3X4_9CELL|nr:MULTISPECIES: peptidoglycan-binding domain-containing protein [Oerskovia]MBD7982735.1 peptidoglycan-binding protein [Oerskovia merdavium]
MAQTAVARSRALKDARKPNIRRIGKVGLWAALLVLAVVLGWWAGRVTTPPDVRPTSEGADVPTMATVVESSVGRSIGVGVTLSQPARAVATNLLPGVVTEVGAADVRPGDLLYAVDGVGVRAAEGDVPFYRDLDVGVKGADVEQLQQMLQGLGLLDHEPDGVFRATTREAVRVWQRSVGVERTGIVPRGTLVAVPTLPAAIRIGDDIALGALLAGGEQSVFATTGDLVFEVVLSEEQAKLVAPETLIRVLFEDQRWGARVSESRQDESGMTVLTLQGADGGSVCGDLCDLLPAAERTTLRGEAVIVPEVTGPSVPTAAVITAQDGSAYVELRDGSQAPVKLLSSAQGIAVVEGLEIGQEVKVGAASFSPDSAT